MAHFRIRTGYLWLIVVVLCGQSLGNGPLFAQTEKTASDAELNVEKSGEANADEILKRFRDSIANAFSFRPKLDLRAFDFLEQFLKYREQEQWSELFRLVDRELQPVRNQMIVSDDGVWVTVAEFCDRVFRGLPPAARDTVRLYVDGRAKVSLKTATETADLEVLSSLYRQFAFSSYGDQFANEFGDALFQAGNFREAASIWHRVIADYPITKFSEARMLAKQAIAFYRAADLERFDQCAQDLRSRFSDATIRLGAEEVTVERFLSRLIGTENGAVETSGRRFVFDPSDDNRWQWSTFWPEMVRSPKQNGTAAFGATSGICIVHLGHRAGGFDRQTGKLTWIVEDSTEESSDDSDRRILLRGFSGNRNSSNDATIEYSDPIEFEEKFFLRMSSSDNVKENPVVRAIDSKTGERIWSTLESLSEYRVICDPQVCHEQIFVLVKKQNSDQILLYSLASDDGAVNWTLQLGSVPPSNAFVQKSSEGRIEIVGNRLFVILEQAMIAVNVLDRSIRWLYRIMPPAPKTPKGTLLRGNRVFLNGRIQRLDYVQLGSLEAMISDNHVFIYDSSSKKLSCLDDARQTKRWSIESKRPAFAGVYENRLYLLLRNQLVVFNAATGEQEAAKEVGSNFGNAALIGFEMVVPTYDGIRVFDLRSNTERTVQPLPEIGVVRRVFRDRNSAVAISRNKVTLFSLAP